jgi:long-subunit acyl-CoA synthetase (AMP-forming)
VGKLVDGQEIIIDPETHEIKQRCAWQMKEYFKDLDQTNITLQNGFLHTGDMGELSADGYLKLTGRVKDCFKTTKGEYIVPGEIEMAFLALPVVDQACVLGILYPQPYVIVVLTEAGRKMNRLHLTDMLTQTLQHYSSNCMPYQKLRKVIIVKEEWTTENGLLTPTFKMKRNALSAKYEEALATAYWKEEPISWE